MKNSGNTQVLLIFNLLFILSIYIVAVIFENQLMTVIAYVFNALNWFYVYKNTYTNNKTKLSIGIANSLFILFYGLYFLDKYYEISLIGIGIVVCFCIAIHIHVFLYEISKKNKLV
jgi:hypothetical protein